ncbi:hypothetical protein BKA62DRAFT_697647 [Auriculariales sp. MPI-PUGE-AT-0066]|nr:hypothetical protein BKA62DRAFT_697647 [Auriculariales sp. MPI-PUGE-AT-0066]
MSLIANARSDIMRNENSYFQLASTGPNDSQNQLELQNLAVDAHLKCALIHRLILRLKQLVPDGPSGMNPAQPQPPQQNNESALLAGGMGQLAGAPGAHNFNQAGQPHPTSDGRFVVGMQEKTIQQQQPAGLQPNGQPQLGHGMQLPQIDGMNQAWQPGLNLTAPGHSPQPPNGLPAGLSAPQLNNPSVTRRGLVRLSCKPT